MSRRRIIRLATRPCSWEEERMDKGSACAKKIRKEIEQLSPFTPKPVGVSVKGGYIPDLNILSEKLDYAVFYNDKRIAVIDTTCSNYTFEESFIMPVTYYKGEIIKASDVPAFIVYGMEKENLPLADRCMWIRGKDVIKCPHHTKDLGGKP